MLSIQHIAHTAYFRGAGEVRLEPDSREPDMRRLGVIVLGMVVARGPGMREGVVEPERDGVVEVAAREGVVAPPREAGAPARDGVATVVGLVIVRVWVWWVW